MALDHATTTQLSLEDAQTSRARLDAAVRRLESTARHLAAAPSTPSEDVEVCKGETSTEKSSLKWRYGKWLHWNAWGYKDTQWSLTDEGHITLTGNRYKFSGYLFPHFRPWIEKATGTDLSRTAVPQDHIAAPEPIKNEEFLQEIAGHYVELTYDNNERVFHAHGHTCQEMYAVRHGTFARFPDAVVFPGSHADVEAIVAAAAKHNVCIVPYGGGTSVSLALECPANEKRMIVSLDMHEMDRILSIDRENMTATLEAGVVGADLERRLAQHGLCFGHEPDSAEFSTLGGWIATRASGMKKNVYGNIEDLLVAVTMVTPRGTMTKSCRVPRMSSGPDIHQMVLGSEGTLGVITQAVVKVKLLPECQQYGSIVFPNFEMGVACMREIARQGIYPASLRLVDNEQFQFSQALKPAEESKWKAFVNAAKKFYVTKYLKYDPNTMVAATLLFEGTRETVARQQKAVFKIASGFDGLSAGAENGSRGYFLTFMIAYIRDYGLEHYFMAESFETSVPWSNVYKLCTSVKARIAKGIRDHGVTKPPFISCRVTQIYDAGACVYFYFGFVYQDVEDPIKIFNQIEEDARDEVIACGGSISHHHGVGKLRKKWLPETISSPGMEALKGLKKALDPNNIFCSGNLIDF